MRCGGHVLIFDVGSGAEGLVLAPRCEDGVRDFDLFFSHCHFDHIMGLPFLKPLYDHEVTARIYAGHFEDGTTCRQMAERFMAPPYFPVTPKYFDAADRLSRLPPAGDAAAASPASRSRRCGSTIRTAASAIAWTIGGRSVCYITDTEHVPGQHRREAGRTIRRRRHHDLRLHVHRRRVRAIAAAMATRPGRKACGSARRRASSGW